MERRRKNKLIIDDTKELIEKNRQIINKFVSSKKEVEKEQKNMMISKRN